MEIDLNYSADDEKAGLTIPINCDWKMLELIDYHYMAQFTEVYANVKYIQDDKNNPFQSQGTTVQQSVGEFNKIKEDTMYVHESLVAHAKEVIESTKTIPFNVNQYCLLIIWLHQRHSIIPGWYHQSSLLLAINQKLTDEFEAKLGLTKKEIKEDNIHINYLINKIHYSSTNSRKVPNLILDLNCLPGSLRLEIQNFIVTKIEAYIPSETRSRLFYEAGDPLNEKATKEYLIKDVFKLIRKIYDPKIKTISKDEVNFIGGILVALKMHVSEEEYNKDSKKESLYESALKKHIEGILGFTSSKTKNP